MHATCVRKVSEPSRNSWRIALARLLHVMAVCCGDLWAVQMSSSAASAVSLSAQRSISIRTWHSTVLNTSSLTDHTSMGAGVQPCTWCGVAFEKVQLVPHQTQCRKLPGDTRSVLDFRHFYFIHLLRQGIICWNWNAFEMRRMQVLRSDYGTGKEVPML